MNSIKSIRRQLSGSVKSSEKVAKMLGVSKESLYRKLAVPSRFTFGEVIVLKRYFNLTTDEVIYIFAPSVAFCN